MAKLRSLRDDSVLGIREVVACGSASVPALRAFLFSREPSGLYEPRRRAVEALAELKAYDVLAEYLATPRVITDPVEQTGEEAVINAAARALADWQDPEALAVLVALTRRAPLAGVVDALAKRRHAEAIPYFIQALAEDFVRPVAEAALRRFGMLAAPALREAARSRFPPEGRESPSSLRARRSALALLAEIPPDSELRGFAVEAFIDDPDPGLAYIGCQVVLASGSPAAASAAVQRLLSLLPAGDALLRFEIEECLAEYFATARARVAEALHQAEAAPGDPRLARALHRVVARATGPAENTRLNW